MDRIARLTLADLAYVSLLFAALTSTWVALSPGPIQLVDVFLVVAAILLGLHICSSWQIPRLPSWLLGGSGTVAVLIFFHLFVSTPPAYMSSRQVLADIETGGLESASQGLQWLVALLVLPFITVAVVGGQEKRTNRVMEAWLLGVVVSSTVSLADATGITNINTALTGIVNWNGRESGLTVHPNNLGISAALAVPFAVWVTTRRRYLGPVFMIILAASAFTSGSRAAQVGFVMALFLAIAVIINSRRTILRLAGGAILGLVAIQLWIPRFIGESLSLVRFDSATAQESDTERAIVFLQASKDFERNPLFGVGLEVITAAHNIYMQLLSSGGLLLFFGITVLFIGALVAAYQHTRAGSPLAGAIFASLATWMVLGAFSNQLTDRYLYFGIAALITMAPAVSLRMSVAPEHLLVNQEVSTIASSR